jgi:methylmalonyl-CoA/ethylmalonyl-CoA epimerase
MSLVRRLDHVALAVPSTEDAIASFVEPLGLAVIHSEIVEELGVRLTYADAGNTLIQLVQPVGNANADLVRWVSQTGGGLHHLCFAADDVGAAAKAARTAATSVRMGRGRGRASAFAPGTRAGVRIEFTTFDWETDVNMSRGYLDPGSTRDGGRDGDER